MLEAKAVLKMTGGLTGLLLTVCLPGGCALRTVSDPALDQKID